MGSVHVDVLVTDQGVAARKNFKEAKKEDTVTWEFRPSGATFEVRFREFLPLGSPLDTDIPRQPLPQQKLFSAPLSTSSSDGQISGTIDPGALPGIYFYEIFDGGTAPLPWLNPISNAHNFGGVQVPPPQ